LAVTRPELWETKISRPATLDECIGDYHSSRTGGHSYNQWRLQPDDRIRITLDRR
jgi:hypothetical protein